MLFVENGRKSSLTLPALACKKSLIRTVNSVSRLDLREK